jgi:hypothetical protein
VLAALAVGATLAISWVAFDKLAGNYETGLQRLSETTARQPRGRAGRRWIDQLVDSPPLNWWLRDPVSRASFLLTAAYLVRDRDVKLRVYPSLAPILVLPLIGLVQGMGRGLQAGGNEFQIAFSGAFLGIVPMFALSLLQYSQQWQASDIFRAAPMLGPNSLCSGARRAVLLFVGFPTTVLLVLLVWLVYRDAAHLELLLPGLIAMPVFALVATARGNAVPLSHPTEEAKSANRGIAMIASIFGAMALSGVASAAMIFGFFWWLIAFEIVASIGLCAVLSLLSSDVKWTSME